MRLALEGERPIAQIAQDLVIGPETLRKHDGLHYAKRRGKPWPNTEPDKGAGRRPDLVNRQLAGHMRTDLVLDPLRGQLGRSAFLAPG